MADKVRVTILGAERYRRTLARARAKLDMQPAHAEVATLVVTRANPPRRSGYLAGSTHGRGLKRAAAVRSSAIYAGPIHYGWPERGIPAQPFAVDSAEQNQPTWADIYTKHLDHIVSEIKGV